MLYSTNDIWRGDEEDRCLEEDLNAMEADIQELQESQGESYTHPASHPAAMITGLAPVATSGSYNDLQNKPTIPAAYTHPDSHPMSMINGLEGALAAKAPNSALSGKADLVDGKVPASQLPGYVDDVQEYANLSAFPAIGESGKIYVAQDTNKTYRWSGSGYVVISDTIALGETSSTAYRGDRGKTAYDHSQNGTVHVTAAQKEAWDGKAAGNHGHNPADIGAADVNHFHSYNELTDKPTIPSTAADIGAIAKALQMTADNGNVEYEMAGLDVLATIQGMPTGMHTGYCPVNSTNAPLSNESWRFLVHKTGVTYGWVLAFGSYGSVYSGYINAGTWRGWKCLIDGTSAPLWKHESDGGYYMTANQTVTPSKPINQCRNGWLLMWSDYDPDTGKTNNADICTTLIPKRGPTGALWSGQGFLCPVATWMDDDTDGDVIHNKKVYVHNDKLVGFAGNNLADRRDIVLRAVYEF